MLLLLWLLLLLLPLGRPVAVAVGSADVDAVQRVRRRIGRPVVGSVLRNHVGKAAMEGGRRLGALVRLEHVEALEVDRKRFNPSGSTQRD